MDDLPGPLRDGRYAVVRLLGEGGQAATFEAVDKKEGQPVAVKRFRVRGAKSWKEVELAEREASVLASLSHPGLPRYVDHFEEGGALYLVTEKIEGESLLAAKKRGARFGEDEVLRFLREASDILDHLHRLTPPVVHRDIKPSNVIRRPDGSFVLIDFGSVRDKLKPEGGSTVVGTFGYMAPEQFQGRAMPGSDVYAVGATALALLTGKEPEELPHRGLAIDVRAALGGGASPELQRALEAMLEPDPDRRATRVAPLLEGIRRPGPRRAKMPPQQERPPPPFPPSPSPPPAPGSQGPSIVAVVLFVALTIAQVAVLLSVQLAVPLLLTLMSLVFGKGMRHAAKRVALAGRKASRSLGQTRDEVVGRITAGQAASSPKVDAAMRAARRVRVAVDEADAEATRIAEEEALAAERAEEEMKEMKKKKKKRRA